MDCRIEQKQINSNMIPNMKLPFRLVFFCFLWGIQYNFLHAQNSVLNQGTWYKIGLTQTGMYKIDAAYLRNAGINLANLNPQHIRVYGNSPGMLPQANNAARPIDLIENAVFVQGENDGKFDNNDYILFFAQSTNLWTFNPFNQSFEHQKNLYADTTFYFLSISESVGKRIQTQENIPDIEPTIDSFDEYIFWEEDNNNILRSGREWYGEQFFGGFEKTISFNLKGLLPNSIIKISSGVMAKDFSPSTFTLSVGASELGQQNIPLVGSGTYDFKGIDVVDHYTLNASSVGNPENFSLKYRYNSTTGNGVGFMNFTRLNFQRRLQLFDNQTVFRSIASAKNTFSNFKIGQVSNGIQIWDVSNPQNALQQAFNLNNSEASFGAITQNQIKEFVVFKPENLPNPLTIKAIANQNLRGQLPPDLLIISAPQLNSQAQRLADFRQAEDGLAVLLVSPEQIYNEFSSGRPDVSAIRDFVRHLYLKDESKLKYLLLFGDASFDYKNRVNENTNLIPIYESRQSLHPIFSYSSDDYFALLGANEGYWSEDDSDEPDLEIGIGRLPVKNLQEAKSVVDKLIYYQKNPATLGDWRRRLAFVADDGDGNTHQFHADELAEAIEEDYPSFSPKKMFMDSYTQESTPSGELCTDLKNDITETLNEGTLLLNFTGHGGEIGWTEERILDIPQIRAWRNLDHLPLFITATCEFGRYDNPLEVSGAEETLLNARGGGIGLITTTRPVFSSTNLVLNRAFYQNVFNPLPSGEMPRLGDIVKNTKNASQSGVVNRNFALLGDPSMRLAYPKHRVKILKINEQNIDNQADTLKALQQIKMEGEIQNALNGNLVNNFTGLLSVQVFDKRVNLKTKGTSAAVMNYQDRTIQLFEGKVDVKAGKFTLHFIVPKDINYKVGKGRINFYAYDVDNQQDALGALDDILVGGSAKNPNNDTQAPQINLFLDNESFVSGNEVGSSTVLLAKLKDESGINISRAGLGHEIIAYLDNKTEEGIILNDYFQNLLNSFQEGVIQYPLKDLKAGKHKLTLIAWDNFNNAKEVSIEFVVKPENNIQLTEVKNYPNPVFNQTTFSFVPSLQNEELVIEIEIFNNQGQLKRLLQTTFQPEETKVELTWNGLDSAGKRLGNGIFIYRINVFSPNRQLKGSVSRKMLIMN
jgi:hypothetical protein